MSKKCVLSDEQKAQVRIMYVDGGMTYSEIGKAFGVCKNTAMKCMEPGVSRDEYEKHRENYLKSHPGAWAKKEPAKQSEPIESEPVQIVVREIIETKSITETDGFCVANEWCKGCMYYGRLGAIRCCDYTYLTGHAKKIEGEPACTCRYKTIGKRPKEVDEE